MIASFSSGMPPTSVYLVLPCSMAWIAASLMLPGVSKSGSPAPRPMTFRPAAFSARALSVTAIVADGFTRASEADRKDIIFSWLACGCLAVVLADFLADFLGSRRGPQKSTTLHERNGCTLIPNTVHRKELCPDRCKVYRARCTFRER